MIRVYKPQGLTPLQTIELLKKTYPDYAQHRISYAGRLDPMAEGLLLLLVDEENKHRKKYETLKKTYEFEVLFGVTTDTYDSLGIITSVSVSEIQKKELLKRLHRLLPTMLGRQKQPYPPFSSKPINGKPLYAWAREGRLHELVIPEKEITITSLSYVSSHSLSPVQLQEDIINRISRVSGNFRQDEIRSSWQDFFTFPPLPRFFLYTMQVSCSSGTYVRSIADRLGKLLGYGAIAYSIKRTRIGNFTLHDKETVEL